MKSLIQRLVTISILLNLQIVAQTNSNISFTIDYDLQTINNHDDDIVPLIGYISSDSVSSYINDLQNFESRFELNENRFDVSSWLYNKFSSFGFQDVKFDSFYTHVQYTIGRSEIDSTYLQRNVVCTIPGYGAPDEVFIIVAHYDSYSTNSNIENSAPGADDNASGTAALLEIARVFSEGGLQPKRTVVLVALAGEELMNSVYSGSMQCAESMLNNNIDVKLAINLDMIGFTDKSLNQSTVNINRHESSSHFAQLAYNSINTYTDINAAFTGYWGADLKPFINAGFYGVYFEENIFNPFYHTDSDLLSNMNIPYCTEVIKGVNAFLIWASGMPNIVENIRVYETDVTNNTLQFVWDSNNDFDLNNYILYVSQNNGTSFEEFSTTDTSFTISGVSDYSTVKYAIAARSFDGYEGFGEIKMLELSNLANHDESHPPQIALYQNFPNPFNPSTTIRYSLKVDSHILITIYDINGNEVYELANDFKYKGDHVARWNSNNKYGEKVPAGIYLYNLSAGEFSETRKMILIK